jgi:hypothetical protein
MHLKIIPSTNYLTYTIASHEVAWQSKLLMSEIAAPPSEVRNDGVAACVTSSCNALSNACVSFLVTALIYFSCL